MTFCFLLNIPLYFQASIYVRSKNRKCKVQDNSLGLNLSKIVQILRSLEDEIYGNVPENQCAHLLNSSPITKLHQNQFQYKTKLNDLDNFASHASDKYLDFKRYHLNLLSLEREGKRQKVQFRFDQLRNILSSKISLQFKFVVLRNEGCTEKVKITLTIKIYVNPDFMIMIVFIFHLWKSLLFFVFYHTVDFVKVYFRKPYLWVNQSF